MTRVAPHPPLDGREPPGTSLTVIHVPRPWARDLALPALAAALTAAFLARALTGAGGTALRDAFDLWVRAAIFGSCAAALLLRARRRDGEGGAWLAAALALLAWEAGDVLLSLQGGVDQAPGPSDACWLLLYPLLAASLFRLLRCRVGRLPRGLWLDAAIGALGTAAVAAAIALPSVLDAALEVDGAELATNLAYPVGDLLLLGATAGVIAASGWRFGRTWSLLGLAYACFAVTDTAFLYAEAHDAYRAGGPLDAGWFAAAVLLAVAAVTPVAPRREARVARDRRLLALPAGFAVVVLGLLVYAAVVGVVAPAVVLATGAFLALIARMCVTFLDMEQATSSLAEAHAHAERLSRTDGLTGLANRRAFAERLATELARGRRQPHLRTGLLLLDVDRFKRVNDRHGHPAGDAVLRAVAARLARTVRTYDAVARWGGEEFAVIVPGIPDGGALLGIAERLRRAVGAEPVLLPDGQALAVTVSVGGSLAAAQTPEALAHEADLALYSAKRTGRNRACVADRSFALDDADDDAARVARSLALAGALREGTTPLHCEQVGDLAAATAAELGLGAEAVRRARLGGLLHDVGKVAMPDGILAKRGPLDDAEWAVMRTHTITGEQLIARVDGLEEAAPAVRHHHERWDGAGYPDGLAGEAIPLVARIVAAADAYAAITDDRTYRRGRSMDEAIAELRRSAGSHLDPAVVAALVRVLERRRAEAAERLAAAHRAEAEAEAEAEARRAALRAGARAGRLGRHGRSRMSEHVWDPARIHHAWDLDLPPALEIASGDVVHLEIPMAGDGQVALDGAYRDCAFDLETIYCVGGERVRFRGA